MEVFTKIFDELHQLISLGSRFHYWSYAIRPVAFVSIYIGTHGGLQAILDMGFS